VSDWWRHCVQKACGSGQSVAATSWSSWQRRWRHDDGEDLRDDDVDVTWRDDVIRCRVTSSDGCHVTLVSWRTASQWWRQKASWTDRRLSTCEVSGIINIINNAWRHGGDVPTVVHVKTFFYVFHLKTRFDVFHFLQIFVGRVGSSLLDIGSGWVKKFGPMYISVAR